MRATVAPGFVTGMLSGWVGRGRDPGPLLAAAGIDPAAFAAGERVPLGQYAVLYNLLVEALADEGFGLFREPLRPGTFEFLCRSLMGSATLGQALDRASRFLALVLPDLAVTVSATDGAARLAVAENRPLALRRDDAGRVFAFEWLLRLLHGLSCWFVARGLALEEVRFPYSPPAHAADYSLVYTEHSRFGGGRLEARFDAALLELPVDRDEAELAAFLEGAPGKITMLYRRDREIVRSVRELLRARLAPGATLEDVAAALHLSPRTLHRRLSDEGSGFRRIKEAVRRDIALDRLEKSRASVARIAAELGYSEPSAFFRAFHGWTGEAPTAYRKRVAHRR